MFSYSYSVIVFPVVRRLSGDAAGDRVSITPTNPPACIRKAAGEVQLMNFYVDVAYSYQLYMSACSRHLTYVALMEFGN